MKTKKIYIRKWAIYIESIYQIKPTIKIIETSYQHLIIKNPVLQELIDVFIKTLENNFLKENLILMYNNLSTLKIQNKNIIRRVVLGIFKDNITTGEYYLYENIISLLPIVKNDILIKYIGMSLDEYVENLYHELLHMSSTIIDKKKQISYSGFYHNKEIGIALDDAYTEIILSRLFNINEKYLSYEYEISITRIIEEIVTKERMTNLYFTANLYDLVKTLEEYNSRENIINFILELDKIYILEDYSKKNKSEIIRCHHKIVNFIIDTYFNKLKQDILSNNLTKEEYIEIVNKYLIIINNQYIILDLENMVLVICMEK